MEGVLSSPKRFTWNSDISGARWTHLTGSHSTERARPRQRTGRKTQERTKDESTMNKLIVATIAGLAGGVVLSTQVAGPLIAQEEGAQLIRLPACSTCSETCSNASARTMSRRFDEAALIEAAINGHAHLARPAFKLPAPARFSTRCRCRPVANSAASALEVHAGRRFRARHHAHGRHARDGGRCGSRGFHKPMSTAPEALLGLTTGTGGGPDARAGRLGNRHHRRSRRGRRSHSTSPSVRDRIRLTAVRSRLEGAPK